MSHTTLFMTNDDGIESVGLHLLIAALHARGHTVVVLAPASAQSSSGMRLTLRPDPKFEARTALASSPTVEEVPHLGH